MQRNKPEGMHPILLWIPIKQFVEIQKLVEQKKYKSNTALVRAAINMLIEKAPIA